MPRRRRDKNEPKRINNFDEMTTMNVTRKNLDKIDIIRSWLDNQEWKKTGIRKGLILNDAVTHLLEKVDINDYM